MDENTISQSNQDSDHVALHRMMKAMDIIILSFKVVECITGLELNPGIKEWIRRYENLIASNKATTSQILALMDELNTKIQDQKSIVGSVPRRKFPQGGIISSTDGASEAVLCRKPKPLNLGSLLVHIENGPS